MGIVPEVIAALFFVGSTGVFFNERFRRNRYLVLCAGVIALLSTYFLTEQIVRQVVRQMLAEEPHQSAPRAVEETRPAPIEAPNSEVNNPIGESPPPQENTSFDPSPPPENTEPARPVANPPVESRPRARRVFDALSIESLAHPEQSPLVFPTAFFNRRLQQELGAISTPIAQIRLRVAFIEPRANRASARDGTVIGYFLVSFPNLPDCTRQFGGPSYAFPDANTGMMGAVNDAAPDIAHWIERASREEVLTCPD